MAFHDPEESFVLDMTIQRKLDSLKEQNIKKNTSKIYRFNPNFISDYKGYTLGMSNNEIDRLHVFRSGNKWVNSAKEFQEVTLISDSLLRLIAPLFQFPEWTLQAKVERKRSRDKSGEIKREYKDLNLATAEELKSIYGVGDKLSLRIVKFRNSLGGFLVNDQLYDVYGLKEEVVHKILDKFRIKEVPVIKKININTATLEEIAQLIYIDYTLAKQIVAYRDSMGIIGSFDELTKIEEFPLDKIQRIELYLSL
ncbi:helix-hairpin-helix domain-containing protein [uncultured Eudoraea sp.]|uniref:ComEA family DNA-binding protein n=1 Tax=uncultured Eudoraea sp. TaxID=1035614 RepID=UPI0026355FAD|nr:helix-hairpin-helix domain-containing protein [uncultured Eudoraea sp.]